MNTPFRRYKPTKEDKLRLPGKNNVETLLLVVDARLTKPTEVILLGRASYEIDDPMLAKHLLEEMNEEQKIHDLRGIPMLTEDVDGFATEETEEITSLAHRGSFVAELCDTYFHPLSEETLFLPPGWSDRLETFKVEGCDNMTTKRLNPLDFILCKASAGRDKDLVFLQAFRKVKGITNEKIKEHWEKTNCINSKKVKEQPSTLANIRRTLGFSLNKPKEILPEI